jgi:serine/threonine protein kinase
MKQEAALCGKLSHPNVVCPFDKFETPDELHLVMEYASGGSLGEYMRNELQLSAKAKVAEHKVRPILRQLVAGLSYLHRNNLCHRDVKLENCVVTGGGTVKLLDFGLGARGDDKVCKTVCGSPQYMAPELIELYVSIQTKGARKGGEARRGGETRRGGGAGGRGGEKEVEQQLYSGKPVDVWALGVLVYMLASGGAPPFEASTMEELCTMVLRGSLDIPSSFSPALQELIRGMLHPDPARRITVDQVADHAFLQEQGTNGMRTSNTQRGGHDRSLHGRSGYGANRR